MSFTYLQTQELLVTYKYLINKHLKKQIISFISGV